VLKGGEAHVWRVRLDDPRLDRLPGPDRAAKARAARFHDESVRVRYLRAHAALGAVLAGLTRAPLDFSVTEKGKPYLSGAPELRFSLSRSQGMALIAAALEVDAGVDVERLRPIPEYEDIAERFFPPSEAAAFAATPAGERERDFFRRWTRLEAMLKARGVGLYGAGEELTGEWTVEEVDAGEGFVGAVAAAQAGMCVLTHDFEQSRDR